MKKQEIANLALSFIGTREYVQGTPTAKICDMWYNLALRNALTYGRWSFSMKRLTLPRIGKDKAGNSMYILPDDCLRLLKIDIPSYELIGNIIYAKTQRNPELTYTSDAIIDDGIPDTQPKFIRGVALLLASLVAPTLTNEPQSGSSFSQWAYQELDEALVRNVQQQASNDQHPRPNIIQQNII